MKKQSILALTVLSALTLNSNAQTFKTSISLEDAPKNAITHVSADKLGSDDYNITIYLAATQEVINEIGTYDFEEVFYINGQRANGDRIWTSYDKSSDARSGEEFLVTPSMKFDLSMETLIEENAQLLNEKGNKIKVEFVHDNDKRVLATCEFTCDVPGFNKFDSDFCDLLDTRNTDKKVESTLHTMFKLIYPHEEIVETLCDGEWGTFKSYDGKPKEEYKTYMIIFKNKGKLWKLRYSVDYVLDEGVLLEKPRVKIYNGLDDPEPVNPSCLKALQSTFN